MLSIGKCQSLGYYEREVIDGREDYLSESGTSPGQWAGTLAAADGFTGPANREDLAAVFSGQHPHGGRLTTHRTTVAGFDLTLSPSKSVSLLWALGTPSDAAEVEAALYAARQQVETYLTQHACLVRRGHAGALVEPGSGFFGAVFRHRTSRLGDPGIHLHWTVFNVTEGPDGRRTALDARALYHHRYAAEAVFQATLRHELTTRLGVVFDEIDRHGVAEIAGITPAMLVAFSRRRAEILTEMERVGSHSGAGARMAALTTRKAKPRAVSEPELRAEWKARASELHFDLDSVVRVPRTPRLAVSDEDLATAVTEQHASYEHRDVVRAVANAGRQGASVTETERGDLQIPMWYAGQHVQYGYARTVHKSQGLTCDVALLLGDDTLYTELGYTALTRGRHENHLYAVTSAADDDRLNDLIVALGTSRAKTAALDTPELAR